MNKSTILRAIAIFFAIETLGTAIWPTLTYALTSGPTAPEATSFEPVDTTDMVNMVTGDFTYNIPLLEVPGPSGGYPLSLSYHGGIQPEQQPSWVGLGWTLNPGSITRTVNGYPDDHHNVTSSTREFWEGGMSETWSVGASVGIVGGPSVSAGVSWGQDTYRGFGMGGYLSASAGVMSFLGGRGNAGVSAGVNFFDYDGDDEKGSVGFNVSIGVGVASKKAEGLSASSSIGFGTGGFSASGGVSYSTPNTNKKGQLNNSRSISGASISTGKGGTSASLSVGGGTSSVNNSNSGRVNTSESGFSADIPTPIPGLNLRLSRQYVRYWSDNLNNVDVNGSLYELEKMNLSASGEDNRGKFDNTAYDTYDLHDPLKSTQDFGTTEKIIGGTFSDYDNYSVNAQGVAGSMRPYHLERVINRQNKIRKETDDEGEEIDIYEVTNYIFNNNKASVKPAQYRFIDDFSNAHSYEPADFTEVAGGELYMNFANGTYGEENGLISADNKLAGTRHIEYFTNKQIHEGQSADLIKAKNYAVKYSDNSNHIYSNYNDQVGAFKITNESGVTYHFALPAYSKNEMTYSGAVDDENVKNFNQLRKPVGYAYTWYLTAITGPDFVDRGTFGELDDEDWGYWVSFEYGMWADNYGWRNPSVGFHTDLDSDYSYFSKGEKEIYYLNYIRTKSHTAIFEKELRKDGKSVVHEFDDKTVSVRGDHKVEDVDEGGFNAKTKNGCVEHPKSLLKLKRVHLVDNDHFSESEAQSLLHASEVYNHALSEGNCSIRYHFGELVVDSYDMEAAFDRSTTIRSIDLHTDYSLTAGMPNTMSSTIDVLNSGKSLGGGSGRLTLKSLSFHGKEGVGGIIPPLRFQYDENPDYQERNGDIWGLYKSDFDAALAEKNEDEGRAVSAESAKHTDAWSLSRITTSLGSTIDVKYESDSYRVVDEFKSYNVNIQGITRGAQGKIRLSLDAVESEYFQVGQEIEFVCVIENEYTPSGSSRDVEHFFHYNTYNTSGKITKVTDTYIELPHAMYSSLECCGASYCCSDGNDGIDSNDPDNPDIPQSCPCADPRYVITPRFLTGNMTFPSENGDVLGGGLRVASITVEDKLLETKRSTLYDYTIDGHTSGVTSYEPTKLQTMIVDGEKLDIRELEDDGSNSARYIAIQNYLAEVFNKDKSRVLTISRDIPGPGVYYEYVSVRDVLEKEGEVIEIPGHSTFQFEVFNEGMIRLEKAHKNGKIVRFSSEKTDKNTGTKYKAKLENEITLKDYSSRIGSLKNISIYNGEGEKVTETINHYLHDSYDEAFVEATPDVDDLFEANKKYYEADVKEQFNNQGVVHETFANARFARQSEDGVFAEFLKPEENYVIGTISKRERYPAIATGQSSINYKTGVTTTAKNLAFDFYSGQVTKTLSSDGYGNYYISETIPAYQKYAGMGLAINGGAHMLTQTAGMTDYKVKSATDHTRTGLVSASAQTWGYDIKTLGTDEDYSEYFDVKIHRTDDLNKSTIVDYHGNLDVGDKFEFSYIYKSYIGKVEQLVSSGTFKEYSISLSNSLEPIYGSHLDIKVKKLGIYKKKASYAWIGNDRTVAVDGLYPYTDFREFTAWTGANSDAQWQKNGEITLYDVYSHALEAEDVNGKYAATKMDSKQERVLATVANARYGEFTHSGFENPSDGGLVINQAIPTAFTGHTGTSSLLLQADGYIGHQMSADETDLSKTYVIQYWVKAVDRDYQYIKPYYKIDQYNRVGLNNLNGDTKYVQKDGATWYLHRAVFKAPPSASTLELGVMAAGGSTSVGHIDDFRVHPIDAAMTSYVYNGWGELSHILDANNLYTEYRYDAMGRLIDTYRETFDHSTQRTAHFIYHYRAPKNNLMGTIKQGRLDHNTHRLSIDFTDPGSGSYSSKWTIIDGENSQVFHSTTTTLEYDVSTSIDRDILVEVVDLVTGLSFTAYTPDVFLQYCFPDGELIRKECMTGAQGCLTGYVTYYYADGNCGTYTEDIFDDVFCDYLNDDCKE